LAVDERAERHFGASGAYPADSKVNSLDRKAGKAFGVSATASVVERVRGLTALRARAGTMAYVDLDPKQD
jgi:hypothetical protein